MIFAAMVVAGAEVVINTRHFMQVTSMSAQSALAILKSSCSSKVLMAPPPEQNLGQLRLIKRSIWPS